MSYILYREEIDKTFEEYKKDNSPSELISSGRRGYNWHDVSVPQYYPRVKMSDLIYYKVDGNQNDIFARLRGDVADKIILGTFDEFKKYVRRQTAPRSLNLFNQCGKVGKRLRQKAIQEAKERYKDLTKSQLDPLHKLAVKLARYESYLLTSLVHYKISRESAITIDGLINEIFPMEINKGIDATQMGFKDKITPDFLLTNPLAIGDLKTGPPGNHYKIALAGYALAYEKQYRKDVDLGFILYFDAKKSLQTPNFEIDVFIVSDTLRNVIVQYYNLSYVQYDVQ